jgi:hypothetical protein
MSNSPLLAATRRRGGGGVAEVSTVTFIPSGLLGSYILDNYFLISDSVGRVYVWFDRDTSYPDPGPVAGTYRGIQVDIGDVPPNTASFYVDALQAVMQADAQFNATKSGNTVTITDAATGARVDIALGTLLPLGASVAVITPGS